MALRNSKEYKKKTVEIEHRMIEADLKESHTFEWEKSFTLCGTTSYSKAIPPVLMSDSFFIQRTVIFSVTQS